MSKMHFDTTQDKNADDFWGSAGWLAQIAIRLISFENGRIYISLRDPDNLAGFLRALERSR